jgi:gamma-glutamylcyclotransferase (GGCT)/AIG2-like uncharacterized protein YtfP
MTWLDEKEGSRHSYRHLDTVALTFDGRSVPVRTYEVVERSPFIEPAKDYLKVCRAAYDHHDLDLTPLDAAAMDESVSPLTSFFVYGTLMRGESRHGAFASSSVECMLLSKAFGSLFDCGPYPAMRLDPEADAGHAIVHGDFIRVSDTALPGLVERLDDIEGFRGFDVDGSLFERRLIEVDVGEGHARRAWVYVMPTVPDEAVSTSGDWRARQGRRRAFLDLLVAIHCGNSEEVVIARKIIESTVAWGERDVEAEARTLVPLADALERGITNERKLAQASGLWAVNPA